MTQNMADDVNMPQNHVNGFEETPGEREDQNEADETEETMIEDEENLEELVENASNGNRKSEDTIDLTKIVLTSC